MRPTHTKGSLDPIALPIRKFMDLFEVDLGGVRFPGVDQEVLQAQAEQVRSRADAIDVIEQQLDAARQELDAAHDDLLRLARRGLAYAKVYAEGDDGLSERLDTILFPLNTARPRRRRRRLTRNLNQGTSALPLT